MEWIELIVHTTTAGSDWVSDCLMELGASGTMIEDRADIPDPSKPHGIWEIIDPKLLDSMPEDVQVHAWFEPDGFPGILERLNGKLGAMRSAQPLYGALTADTRMVSEDAWAEVWKKFVTAIGNDVLKTSNDISLCKRTTGAAFLLYKSDGGIAIGKLTNSLIEASPEHPCTCNKCLCTVLVSMT